MNTYVHTAPTSTYNYLTYSSYLYPRDLPYHALVVAQHHPSLQLGAALDLPIHRIYKGEDTLGPRRRRRCLTAVQFY